MVDPLTGTVLSGFVKVVLGKLATNAFKELTQIYGVKSQFRKLRKTLSAINDLLEDAEKQHGNNSMRNWLLNIKDLVYDIEDLLDLVSTKGLERKVNRRSIRRQLSKPYSRYSLTQQVKEICKQLDEIAKIERDFNLRGYRSEPRPVRSLSQQGETGSHIQELVVVGRQADQESIVSRLLQMEQQIVLPIVGMGGIGKTTLAKLVFNDPNLRERFNPRLWVHVSRNFEPATVIQNIIQSAIGVSFPDFTLENLQNKLLEILKKKTFLLVLDDVWVNDLTRWLNLEKLLFAGSVKSAIIVSTREENVANVCTTQPTEIHKLQELSEDDSWSLFVSTALKDKEVLDEKLVAIGKSITKKCKGNPLAVKTLASLLRNERQVCAWRRIQSSEIWNIRHEGNVIMPVLKVSFDHTPYYLKSCFTYCAIFGKGFPMHRSDLINFWMAQGLLEDKDDNIEDDGETCVDQLLSRSFFQPPGYDVTRRYVMEAAVVFNWHQDWANLAESFNNNLIDNVESIRKHFTDYRGKLPFVEMHDLMHDLAAYVSGEEIANVSSSTSEISERARHVVWDKEDLSGKEFPKGLMKGCKARTFAFLHPMGSLSKSFLESLLASFKCLRVLMLLDSEFEELPDLIGDLKHLRYIDVCLNTKLKLLPNSICKLVNLQVLDFGNCTELKRLPNNMHKLVSLRSLTVTTKATTLPKQGFQCWSSLRVLKIFRCPALTSLPKGMGGLKSLKVLGVELCSSLGSLPDDLKQLANLEELSIAHCQQLELAQWDGLVGLTNLEYLRLYGIPKLVDFPKGINSLAESLKLLRIGDCYALKSLPEELGLCTALLKLQLYGCGELCRLPEGVRNLLALEELTIAGCFALSRSCERDTGEDWSLISHIPSINIDIQERFLSTQE